MDIFLLYLFTRVDALISAMGGVMLGSIIGSIVLTAMYLGMRDHYQWETKEKHQKDDIDSAAALKWAKRIWFYVLPAMIVGIIVVPTQKDLAIIVGGHLSLEAVKSDTAKKVYAIIQDRLDDELSKIAKKKDSK